MNNSLNTLLGKDKGYWFFKPALRIDTEAMNFVWSSDQTQSEEDLKMRTRELTCSPEMQENLHVQDSKGVALSWALSWAQRLFNWGK